MANIAGQVVTTETAAAWDTLVDLYSFRELRNLVTRVLPNQAHQVDWHLPKEILVKNVVRLLLQYMEHTEVLNRRYTHPTRFLGPHGLRDLEGLRQVILRLQEGSSYDDELDAGQHSPSQLAKNIIRVAMHLLDLYYWEIGMADEMLTEARQERREQKERVHELEEENERLRSRNATLNDDVNRLKGHFDSLAEVIKAQGEEVQRQRQELDKQQARIQNNLPTVNVVAKGDDLNRYIESQNDTIAQLQGQVQDKKRENRMLIDSHANLVSGYHQLKACFVANDAVGFAAAFDAHIGYHGPPGHPAP